VAAEFYSFLTFLSLLHTMLIPPVLFFTAVKKHQNKKSNYKIKLNTRQFYSVNQNKNKQFSCSQFLSELCDNIREANYQSYPICALIFWQIITIKYQFKIMD